LIPGPTSKTSYGGKNQRIAWKSGLTEWRFASAMMRSGGFMPPVRGMAARRQPLKPCKIRCDCLGINPDAEVVGVAPLNLTTIEAKRRWTKTNLPLLSQIAQISQIKIYTKHGESWIAQPLENLCQSVKSVVQLLFSESIMILRDSRHTLWQ